MMTNRTGGAYRAVVLTAALMMGVSESVRGTEQPISIETGLAQLFVDDHLIEKQQGLKRTLHQPKKDFDGNVPVIAPPTDFGEFPSTLEANGSIVYDSKLQKFVMFALGCALKKQSWDRVRLYRFTSHDGINWSEGQRVFPRSREDFLHPKTGEYATNMDLFSCFYDEFDPAYPYKAWCWFANWGDQYEGIHLLKSKDGRHWERGSMIVDGRGSDGDPTCKRLKQDGRDLRGAGDVTIFYHDKLRNRFLGLIKFFSATIVENNNRLRSRAYAFMDRMDEPFNIQSIDHVALVPAAAEKNGDMPHDEYYASTAWRYESLWLGWLKVWHGEGDYPYSAAGCAFLKLAVSRDGLNWKKVAFENEEGHAEVFLANGPEGGSDGRNDGGYMTQFSTGPFVRGTDLIFYYGASSYGKNHSPDIRITGGGIFRARLRIDGFVSVNDGTLTTKLLDFEGKRLTVNSSGPVNVEVLDAQGKTLGTTRLNGDSLRHEVHFGGKSLAQVVDGHVARFRFTSLGETHLYSFTIWDE